ncbi:hypothetical protein [Roseibium litorale]|uniref:Uncharacterized protein n=1 Tax=Roseibium litorale TaxID=2803841 RepID=A0ABR9CQC6_9HYPH|nr:hypothetical protein [Roseibium litorale]MBD8892859.1 hypothetical protein [Roseibium litorale]
MQALASLAANAATQEAKTRFRRLRRNFVLLSVTGLFGLTAYTLLITAGVHSLWMQTGSFLAASLLGALGFAFAAVIPFAVMRFISWREEKRLAKLRRARMLATTAAIGLLPRIFGSKTGLAAVAAGVFAFYMMNRPPDDDSA